MVDRGGVMISIDSILEKIEADLAWLGPNEKVLGHICLTREQAQYLRNWARTIIEEYELIRK